MNRMYSNDSDETEYQKAFAKATETLEELRQIQRKVKHIKYLLKKSFQAWVIICFCSSVVFLALCSSLLVDTSNIQDRRTIAPVITITAGLSIFSLIYSLTLFTQKRNLDEVLRNSRKKEERLFQCIRTVHWQGKN
jgi:ABC-type multidrug transport system fused ATPase/permease subunit